MECKLIPSENAVFPEKARWAGSRTECSHLYQCRFTLDAESDLTFSLAAQPGWQLFMDGEYLASFRTQGTRVLAFYDTFSLRLSAGEHRLQVLVLHYGAFAPASRMSAAEGIAVFAPGEWEEKIGTGFARWEVTDAPEYRYTAEQSVHGYYCAAGVLTVDYSLKQENFQECVLQEPLMMRDTFNPVSDTSRCLLPDPLPEFNHSRIAGAKLVRTDELEDGSPYGEEEASPLPPVSPEHPLEIPDGFTKRFLFDLGNYYCGNEMLVIHGAKGSSVTVGWAEALPAEHKTSTKERRSEVTDRYIDPARDIFRPSGNGDETFRNADYRAGRFIEIIVKAEGGPVILRKIQLTENRYPLESQCRLFFPDKIHEKCAKICVRTLQMCAHDTFMDCPHYEQLMYVGDLRPQLLVSYVITRDRVLQEHILNLLTENIVLPDGGSLSRFPCVIPQEIPSFSLTFVNIFGDYVRYAGKPAMIRKMLPVCVRILMHIEDLLNRDGVIRIPYDWLRPRWDFVDWSPVWHNGTPPKKDGVNGVFSAFYLYTLNYFAETCRLIGEAELEVRFRRLAGELFESMLSQFFCEEESLFADTPDKKDFSEQMNVLMLLSGAMGDATSKKVAHAMFDPAVGITECSLSFDLYYFAAAAKFRRMDKFFERSGDWRKMLELDAKTCFERMDNFKEGSSRSDCHAWSSNLLYHFYASVAGLRPVSAGGRDFLFDPQPGPFGSISGTMPAEKGEIYFNVNPEKTELYSTEGVTLKRV